MSNALSYEHFVRRAFEFALNREIDRWGDPATLANTDYFSNDLINRVKSAVGYSMEIFNAHIREQEVSDSDYTLMDQLLDQVISATNVTDISVVINQYKTAFFEKYKL